MKKTPDNRFGSMASSTGSGYGRYITILTTLEITAAVTFITGLVFIAMANSMVKKPAGSETTYVITGLAMVATSFLFLAFVITYYYCHDTHALMHADVWPRERFTSTVESVFVNEQRSALEMMHEALVREHALLEARNEARDRDKVAYSSFDVADVPLHRVPRRSHSAPLRRLPSRLSIHKRSRSLTRLSHSDRDAEKEILDVVHVLLTESSGFDSG